MGLRPSRRLLGPLVVCVAMALPAIATASAAAAGAPCGDANLVPTAANGAQVRAATLCLINVERASRGLRAVRADSQLRSVAQRYSRDMVSHRFFAHVGYDGSTLRSRISGATHYLSRVSRWSLGENLYWGSGELSTPQQSVQAWMHSPGHRRNLLDKTFRDVGIGIAIGAPEDVQGSPSATYTTEYGTHTFR
ncbi:MAG: hypothetical protein QOE11_1833 [Solirubrobacteraceae bacterium]|jgi:uncharacterized protein YkwD|nr:hypothetical protein [Solirubrobacteraceae bacterium]